MYTGNNFEVTSVTNSFNFRRLTVATINVGGLANDISRTAQFSFLKQQRYNVVLAQETHASHERQRTWEKSLPGMQCLWANGPTNARGVSIFLDRSMQFDIIETKGDDFGRWLWVLARFGNVNLGIMNIYSPNIVHEQEQFYEFIHQFLMSKKQKDTHFIIGGDWNTYFSLKWDRMMPGGQKNKEVSGRCEKIMQDMCLVDMVRKFHPNEKFITWKRWNSVIRQWRGSTLDRFLISQSLEPIATKLSKQNMDFSDHDVVELELQGADFVTRGSGNWKLNVEVLKEESYKELIDKTHQELQQEYAQLIDVDPRRKWECFKVKVRQCSIVYCKKRNTMRKKDERILREKLEKLEAELVNQNPDTAKEYKIAEAELQSIVAEDTRRNILRTKSQFMSYGEKGTKLFYGRVKQKFAKSGIMTLENEEGKECKKQKEVQHIIRTYFQQVFQSRESLGWEKDLQRFVQGLKFPQITKGEKDRMNAGIEEEEVLEAVMEMAKDKSPGIDGLPVEFYQVFWELIKENFIQAMQKSMLEGKMIGTQAISLITLIPKAGINIDLQKIQNYRPISLLCVDRKIYSKILAKRMERVIPALIHPDAVGFVKNRYIGQTIRVITDVMEEWDRTQDTGFLVSLDLSKAFDSVEWRYIFKVLSLFGFPEEFLSGLEVLYTDLKATVANYGYTTDMFELHRGVPQGDPASPGVFLFAIEILATVIRRRAEIKGLELANTSVKIALYADDCTLFLKDTQSIEEMDDILQVFAKVSGLQVNPLKTKVMGLGRWAQKKGRIRQYIIDTDPIKILGMWFSHDKQKNHDLNVNGKIEKIRKCLQAWWGKAVTMQGRILIAKTLGLSQIIYSLMNITVQEEVLNELQKVLNNYIWSGKQVPSVRRTVFIQEYKAGGLKSPDCKTIQKSLQISWINRMRDSEFAPWKAQLVQAMEPFGGLDYILGCDYSVKDLLKRGLNLGSFWMEIIKRFEEFKVMTTPPIRKEELFLQLINNNKHIQINGSSFFEQALVDAEMDEWGRWFLWNGTVMKFEHIRLRKVNITKLRYNQIVSAFPKEWKALMKNATDYKYEIETRPHTKNAKRYWIKQIAEEPPAILKWRERDQINVKWSQYYNLARKTTKYVKLQEFQYKVLHRVVATNHRLHKMKKKGVPLVPSPNCRLCGQDETLTHLLLYCKEADKIWKWLQAAMFRVTGKLIELFTKDCVLGIPSKKKEEWQWNWLALQLRYYLYTMQRADTKPTIQGFKASLRGTIETVKAGHTSLREQRLFRFHWQLWLDEIDYDAHDMDY